MSYNYQYYLFLLLVAGACYGCGLCKKLPEKSVQPKIKYSEIEIHTNNINQEQKPFDPKLDSNNCKNAFIVFDVSDKSHQKKRLCVRVEDGRFDTSFVFCFISYGNDTTLKFEVDCSHLKKVSNTSETYKQIVKLYYNDTLKGEKVGIDSGSIQGMSILPSILEDVDSLQSYTSTDINACKLSVVNEEIKHLSSGNYDMTFRVQPYTFSKAESVEVWCEFTNEVISDYPQNIFKDTISFDFNHNAFLFSGLSFRLKSKVDVLTVKYVLTDLTSNKICHIFNRSYKIK